MSSNDELSYSAKDHETVLVMGKNSDIIFKQELSQDSIARLSCTSSS